MRRDLLSVSLALFALSFGTAMARDAAAVEVDVELVLAVDVSWSMDRDEQQLQRDGYVAALRDETVQDAILNGPNGRVAITYVEWAGQLSQSVVIPWTLIDSKEAADGFAYRLSVEEADRERRTSISSAIDFVVPMFENNGFEGMRQVIDVSGDGPNNQGRTVTEARDAATARGITINGLPLMTAGEGSGGFWGSIPDLDAYYRDCVIGGPGAFMIPVNGWDQFPAAVRRKLIMELAGGWPLKTGDGTAPILPVAGERSADCLIGETMWRQRQDRWGPN